ncbi:sigma-70 family RNA polymerase sigma factor [Metasolibacillus meyeri]|uniref:sigma-70 family RNA polymerase sigma factor n=1 Tax=Metasolibacillus meyeri TaxID=1071052 RepID=UPI000D30AD1A|nr:sigma-70 family RNA polymerase sigma factor [Metasolibacillus meyeri]
MSQLEQFIHEHGEELLRLAFTYVKSKEIAEDIVQDVLLKAFEKQQEFRGAASYRTYLYRMTINRSYDYLRSWSYKNTVLTMKIQTIFQGASSAEKQAITNSEQQQIGHAVLALPIKYREVIVLYYYKDMKVETIAEILNCSVNTVKTRLRRGREKLKYSLEGSGYDERFTN